MNRYFQTEFLRHCGGGGMGIGGVGGWFPLPQNPCMYISERNLVGVEIEGNVHAHTRACRDRQ